MYKTYGNYNIKQVTDLPNKESSIVTPDKKSSESSNIKNSNSPDLQTPQNEAQLLEQIRKQIEYYFSKENLANDSFLRSHMDGSMSVPVSVIMNVIQQQTTMKKK